jgi:hypothetical protein
LADSGLGLQAPLRDNMRGLAARAPATG